MEHIDSIGWNHFQIGYIENWTELTKLRIGQTILPPFAIISLYLSTICCSVLLVIIFGISRFWYKNHSITDQYLFFKYYNYLPV